MTQFKALPLSLWACMFFLAAGCVSPVQTGKPFQAQGSLSYPKVSLADTAWKAPNGETTDAWSRWNDLGTLMAGPAGPIYVPSGSNDSSRLQMGHASTLAQIQARLAQQMPSRLEQRLLVELRSEPGWLGRSVPEGTTQMRVVISAIQLCRQPALAGFKLQVIAAVDVMSANGTQLYKASIAALSSTSAPLGALEENKETLPKLSQEAIQVLAANIREDLRKNVKQ